MQGDMPGTARSARPNWTVSKPRSILGVHQPGTPKHGAARQEIRAEIEVADAEMLGIHGPGLG